MDRQLNNEIYEENSGLGQDYSAYCANNPTQKIFYYDSRRAGGGKTWDIIETTSRLAKLGRKCLIVQPTTGLIDETFDGFSNRHPTVTTHKFHSDDGVEGGTMARVMSYFNNADLEGAVVLITHSTFLALPYFYRKDRWNLYIDEEIRPFEYFSKLLIRNHTAITDHVELMDNASSYRRLRVTGHSDLKVIADNKGNDVMTDHVRDLAKRLLSPNYDSYVDISKFKALTSSKSKDGGLSVFSILKPSLFDGFERVTIAGARFEETLTYHWWEQAGVRWRVCRDVQREAVSQVHPHNKTVTIHYGYEENYSKKMRNKLGDEGKAPIIEAVSNIMGERKFIRVENNDVKHISSLNKLETCALIPGISHGLNSYMSYDHAAIITANNPPSEACKFLKEVCKFDSDQQFVAFTNHSIYQAVCRTSIRRNEANNEKIWVVPSKTTAVWLTDIFPGSSVKSLGLKQLERKKPGRKATNENDNARKNKSKHRSKRELALSYSFASALNNEILNEVTYLDKGDELGIRDISHFVAKFRASYFDNYMSSNSQALCLTNSQFVTYLRKHAKNVYREKNEIPCVSGAMFRASKSNDTNRGTLNVEFVRGLWFDIEKGTMSHQQFADMFPRSHIVAYNTFNHTKKNPRYRIYVPTNRAMTDKEYRLIYTEIVYVLESKGFLRGSLSDSLFDRTNHQLHGIDYRPAPCSLFALPCQAKNPADSFFKEYKGDDCKPIDVDVWLQNLIAPDIDAGFDPAIYEPEGGDIVTISDEQQIGINHAMAEWYRIGVMPSEGHDALFALHHTLRSLRLHPDTIGERLYEAARFANSPIDRRKQVDRLMAGLRSWHRRAVARYS